MNKPSSKILTILCLVLFASCGKKTTESGTILNNLLQVDDFKTPLNRDIKFKKIGDQVFLQWYCEGELRTYEEPFDLKGAEAWIPWFIVENNDYILRKAGCGSPCWNGYFLPLKKSLKFKIINEYLVFDPAQNYVAKINYNTDLIEVENVVTSKTQSIKTEKCEAAFKAFCIDTIYFTPKKIVTKWHRENAKSNVISQTLQL